MDILKFLEKYGTALSVIFTVIAALMWFNGKFNALEKDMAVIKTVLIMRNLMPNDLQVANHCHNEE